MFSANENILLRQHKRRVVEYVERTIPDPVLDLGTSVMVMQVSCVAPGCVPLETAIVIVFPASQHELIPGLPASAGGSYKAKVLKPMADVVADDILEVLPPQFQGGRRSGARLALQARDVMLGQITQLFNDETDGDASIAGRTELAQYLQQCLQTYLDRGCVPPEWGQEFPQPQQQDDDLRGDESVQDEMVDPSNALKTPERSSTQPAASVSFLSGTGNIVMKRAPDDDPVVVVRSSADGGASYRNNTAMNTNTTTVGVNTVVRRRQQQTAERKLQSLLGNTPNGLLSQLAAREHAPGIRRPGCPCCDPDHPTNIVDQLMQL